MQHRDAVLEAIKKLGHSVSAADVAAATGLSLFEARTSLNKIALDTRAVLEVSGRGEISYKFFPDLESIYRIVGIKKLLLEIGKHLYNAAFFLLRVSFGILLIASTITIMMVFAVALVFILFGIGAAEAADGDLDLSGLDMDFFDFDELPAFFAWSTLAGAQTPTDFTEDYLGRQIDTGDKGFFQNCFSFLFGDGDPNKKLEETQWQYIAELIRKNRGVVTAEQVAPYLLKLRTESRSMLAVMVRFDGVPEVTQMGNLVYSFPSLQVTASGDKITVDLPDKLTEQEWKFSRVPTERLHWVFFFAGANLCGAYALNQHLAWFQPLLPYADLIHWTLVYAAFFMGFPILRELLNNVRNAFVELRNKKRAKNAAALSSGECRFKIQEARNFAIQMQNLAAQQAFYTTGEDILGQGTDELSQHYKQVEQQANAQPQIPAHQQEQPQFPQQPQQLQYPPQQQQQQQHSWSKPGKQVPRQ